MPLDTIYICTRTVPAPGIIGIVSRNGLVAEIQPYREDMSHPIKKKLDMIITEFLAGKLSYGKAKNKIIDTVDGEVEKVNRQVGKGSMNTAYKDIVSLGEAKKNAFARLKRKKNIKHKFFL